MGSFIYSWCFLGLCIQLYVQNWPLGDSLWRLWNTGMCARFYLFTKYTYSWYRHDDVRIYFINSQHINKGSTGFREMFEKCWNFRYSVWNWNFTAFKWEDVLYWLRLYSTPSLLRDRWHIQTRNFPFPFCLSPLEGYREIYIGFNLRKWNNHLSVCMYVYYYVIGHKLLKMLEFDCRQCEGSLIIDVLSVSNSNRPHVGSFNVWIL